MSSFGQLIAGAGRVGQGMDAARERRQALEDNELRLMEMRRKEEAARRAEEARRQAAEGLSPLTGGLNTTFGSQYVDPLTMQQVAAQQPQVQAQQQAQAQQAQAQQPAMLQQGQIPSRNVAPFDSGEFDLTQYTTTPDVAALQQDTYTPRGQAVPVGEITREQFDALSPQLQQEYLDTVNARRAVGRVGTAAIGAPLAALTTPFTMLASGAARTGEYIAESPFGRVLGLSAPGEQVNLGARDPYAPSTAYAETMAEQAPLTLEEYRASLPTGTAQPAQPTPTETAEQPTETAATEAPEQPTAGVNIDREDPIEQIAANPPPEYKLNPVNYDFPVQQGMRKLEDLRRMHEIYRANGLTSEMLQVRGQIYDLTANLDKMIKDQAIAQASQEFNYYGDPRRLVGIMQQIEGVPLNIQPRSDGKYNMFVGDNMFREGLDTSEITDMFYSMVDQDYVDNKIKLQTERAQAGFESDLKMQEELAKQNAQMIREAAIERIKGDLKYAELELGRQGIEIKPAGDGVNAFIIKDGQYLALYNTQTDTAIDPKNPELQAMPLAQAIDLSRMR